MMKYVLIVLLVFAFLPSSTLALDYEETYVIWPEVDIVYADEFPVMIEGNRSGIVIQASWLKENITQTVDNQNELVGFFFYEIPIGNDTEGSGTVYVYKNETLLSEKQIEWRKREPINPEDIQDIKFIDKEFLYWTGSSTLFANYSSQNKYQISNTVEHNGAGKYTTEFNFTGEFEFSSLLSVLDLANIHKYQSFFYSGRMALCDGGGYYYSATFVLANRSVSIDYLLDNDSCSGLRTYLSDPAIYTIFDNLLKFTDQLIVENNRSITVDTSSTLVTSTVSDLSYLFPLSSLLMLVPISSKRVSRK